MDCILCDRFTSALLTTPLAHHPGALCVACLWWWESIVAQEDALTRPIFSNGSIEPPPLFRRFWSRT